MGVLEIAGSVVVVTGGASGIGRALCRRFAADGALVTVADRDDTRASEVASEIGAVAMRTDVAREADVHALVAQVVGTHGRIDLYCSNAGVGVGGGPEAGDADWQRSWDVHVMAHVYAARALLPGMIARHAGYILGTVSAAGLLNHVFAAPYAVTKAAELSFFEWLAIAHKDDGIRVSVLCPMGVKTPMLEAEINEHSFLMPGALEPEQVADSVVDGLREEKFLILPHPEVAEFFQRKASDYDRWLRGMTRLRNSVLTAT
jgi:NAD(P)-dependent dehydrogenase (short-subunit alcohol dehydrogenase family)